MIDYLEQCRTINGAYCAGKLRRLRQEIARKRRGKMTSGVLLLQDNASAHTSLVAMAAVTNYGFEILPHSPSSTGMALSNYYLFPKLKSHLRGSNESIIIMKVDKGNKNDALCLSLVVIKSPFFS